MEHRWNVRRPVNASIGVRAESIGLIIAAVRNVSREGMLLDTGHTTLPKGIVVDLVGAVDHAGGKRLARLRAMTIHVRSGRAGVLLIEPGGGVADAWFAAVPPARSFPEAETASGPYASRAIPRVMFEFDAARQSFL